MSLEFHIDSVREVATSVVSLPARDGDFHFQAQLNSLVLYICLSPGFPVDAPRISTQNGLSLYDASNWTSSKLLGEEVQLVFSRLARLWGDLSPSGIDFGSVRRLAACCDDVAGLQNDSLARRSVLIRGLSSAAAVTDATARALSDLEDATSRTDLLANSVGELQVAVEELRSKCTLSTHRFPKGLGTQEGLKMALTTLHDEKDRQLSEHEATALRVAAANGDFDAELSRLMLAYKEAHLLELKAKLVRTL